jgi:hypothetical protein
LIETDNEDIKDYRKRRMFTDTVYFSPVSDRLEILKARLEELPESKIAEIKKIIDGNISE